MSTVVASKGTDGEMISISGELAAHVWAEDCGWEYLLSCSGDVYTITAIDHTSGQDLRTDTSGSVEALRSFLDSSKIGCCAWGACVRRLQPVLSE